MAERCDLVGIKEQMRVLFETNNTTTSTVLDLSSNLTRRVQKVFKVHPEMIPIQASLFPYVTCYIDNKQMGTNDIASSQLNAKRRSTITVNVVGMVFNANFSRIDEDPADEDINYLMENVEYILRSDSTLNSKVKWQIPSNTQYYSARLDNQTHLRAGVLQLQAQVFY